MYLIVRLKFGLGDASTRSPDSALCGGLGGVLTALSMFLHGSIGLRPPRKLKHHHSRTISQASSIRRLHPHGARCGWSHAPEWALTAGAAARTPSSESSRRLFLSVVLSFFIHQHQR